ncbi:MAG: CCA tRNA nucleotidyltransferase [Alphaproteobacteria bacterium]|nr:CCA tRNA nucleotidyltransferase [Alphaproteobacteria bacterium]
MTAALDPADHAWLRAGTTRRVLGALNAETPDAARIVGGAVRNAIMGRPVDDIDIATTHTPDAASALLEAAGLKVVPTGIEHGTVTAVADGQPFEVTTLRKDVETFGRRAVVAFTTDWAEDAARRDFRLNAIYCGADGSLFDPFGGIEDARAGRIVFIGEPRDRIAEDHLRILRFYRFLAWYGDDVDRDGQAACAAMAGTLKALSAERVWKELKKLLAAPDPRLALEAMQEGHVLEVLIPGALDFRLLLSLINRDRGKARAPNPLLRLTALAGGDEAAMTALCEQMKASNAERAYVQAVCVAPDLAGDADQSALARAVYEFGDEAIEGRLRLAEAQSGTGADEALNFLHGFARPVFPVKGRDLLEAGFPRGPELGQRLAELEQAWIESGFALDRVALLERAKRGEA